MSTTQSGELVRRLEVAPAGVKSRRFTLRDDKAQHYHRQMQVIQSPVYVQLAWRANAQSQVPTLFSRVFRLDLRGLLSAGYIRPERANWEDEVRVRFYRASNGMIYLQVKQGSPALAVIPAPV